MSIISNRSGKAETAFAEVVKNIPSGQVLSYRQVAERAGYPKAARAVGNFLSKNHDPKIPCHRVICSDGRLGSYNRGAEAKYRLLYREGALTGSSKAIKQSVYEGR